MRGAGFLDSYLHPRQDIRSPQGTQTGSWREVLLDRLIAKLIQVTLDLTASTERRDRFTSAIVVSDIQQLGMNVQRAYAQIGCVGASVQLPKGTSSRSMMTGVQFENGIFDVDAEIIGRGLGLEAERIQVMMRNGEISSRSERGEGQDAGRYRLTFFHGNDRFSLIVDESGRIIEGPQGR